MHHPEPETDKELVSRTVKRDAHTFEILFNRYATMLHRHVVGILHDETAAHDAVQETFMRVWERADQWQGTGTFKAWLYRTATNLALNHLRTIKRRRETPLEIPADPAASLSSTTSGSASILTAKNGTPCG